MGECVRSGFCNFMHLKPISRELRRELYGRRGAQSGLGNHGRNKVSKAKLYLINNFFLNGLHAKSKGRVNSENWWIFRAQKICQISILNYFVHYTAVIKY